MPQRKKIDTTLQERHGILQLLERLKQESITLDEMEEIGVKLKKSGKRALRPLVRRLWRERSGDLISKYAYLLDFFEDDVWIDQLIQIALKRRDLDNDGKAAMLAALEGYGVDISSPPFSTLFAGIGVPLNVSVPEVLERGEEGVISFMDEFLHYPREIQLHVISELASVEDLRVLSLLEVMLRLDNSELAEAALIALGRIKDERAAAVLQQARSEGDESLRKLAGRSLRRLAFLGVVTDKILPPTAPLPFHACYAGPPDGDGQRSLVLSRWADIDTLAALYLQVDEIKGIVAAWGCGRITPEEFAEELTDIRGEEGVVAVAADYALVLARDALYRSRENQAGLPADFYVRRSMFRDGELVAAPYQPDFQGYDPRRQMPYAGGTEAFDSIFDDDFFSCWFMANGSVYDFAEEWSTLEKNCTGKMLAKGLEGILERFCRTLFAPVMERIRRRLLLTADLMRHSGREPALVGKTVAIACSLEKYELPYHYHPFLRRFALESMDMAREALAEGYDLRQHGDGTDDDDWE
jgi:hypothetical protein